MVIGWGLHVRPWLLVEMKDATAVATEITSTASVPWNPEPFEPQPIPFCMNFQEAGWHFSRFVLSAVEIAHVLVEQAWKCQRPFNYITLTVELTCLKASLFKSVWLIIDNTSRRACCHPLCACVRETAAICSLITVDEPIACVMKKSSSDAMSLGHTMLVTPWSPERIVGISDTPETKPLPPLLIFEEVDPQVNWNVDRGLDCS